MKFLAILAIVCTTALSAAADSPRAGTYRILSYGASNRPPLVLGSFVLGAGTYRALLNGGRLEGEGRFSFDPATKKVTWESGPYKGVWDGDFTIERGGKTHRIRMKRTTVGVNSID